MNPIIQYTAFEQLKNFLVARRTNKLRATGGAATVATLTDWDFFLLGALSKLGKYYCTVETLKNLILFLVATAITYPYMYDFIYSLLQSLKTELGFQCCQEPPASRLEPVQVLI